MPAPCVCARVCVSARVCARACVCMCVALCMQWALERLSSKEGLLRAASCRGGGHRALIPCIALLVSLSTLCLALILDSQGGHIRSLYGVSEKGSGAGPHGPLSPRDGMSPVCLQP